MVNLAGGAFYHCVKRPCWGLNRDTSLSSTDSQPFLGVGNETNKVDGDLGVKQNNTILSYLYYFLQIMSWKRIWIPVKRFQIHSSPLALKGTLILSLHNLVSSLFLQIKDFLSFLANSLPLFKISFSTLATSIFLSTEITKWPCLMFTKIFPLRKVMFSIVLITLLKLGSPGLKSSDSTNFVGFDLAPTTVFGFRCMTKPWYSLTLFQSILCITSLRPLEAGKPSLVSRGFLFLLLFSNNLSKWFTICLSWPGIPNRKTLSFLYTGWRGFHNIFCGNQPQRYTLQQKIGNPDKLYLEPPIFFFFFFFFFFLKITDQFEMTSNWERCVTNPVQLSSIQFDAILSLCSSDWLLLFLFLFSLSLLYFSPCIIFPFSIFPDVYFIPFWFDFILVSFHKNIVFVFLFILVMITSQPSFHCPHISLSWANVHLVCFLE